MSNNLLDIRDIARSGHVTRWHSVRVARQQTLAEHHYMVVMISQALLDMLEENDNEKTPPELRLEALSYALIHDTPELLMGDLPSPLKRRVEQFCAEGINPLDAIEEQIAPQVVAKKKFLKKKHPALYSLVKLADLIDAIIFIEQEGIGRHARKVAEGLKENFTKAVDKAQADFPAWRWEKAWLLLEKLTQHDANQIAFEG